MGDQISKRRDYTNEIIAATGNKFKYVTQPATDAKSKRHGSRKIYLMVIFVAFTLVGVGSLIYFLNRPANPNPIPQRIRESVTFNLYYPMKLPDGYSINKNSLSQQPNVVTYYAQNKQGRKLFFSIQPVPQKVSLDDFSKRVLQNPVNVVSNTGQAAVGKVNNNPTASLTTNKSWVLITSPALSTKDLAAVVSNLRQVY